MKVMLNKQSKKRAPKTPAKIVIKLDKECLRIFKKAVTDLVHTKKFHYLNMINSFILANVQLTDDVYKIFKVLEDNVSISLMTQ